MRVSSARPPLLLCCVLCHKSSTTAVVAHHWNAAVAPHRSGAGGSGEDYAVSMYAEVKCVLCSSSFGQIGVRSAFRERRPYCVCQQQTSLNAHSGLTPADRSSPACLIHPMPLGFKEIQSWLPYDLPSRSSRRATPEG